MYILLCIEIFLNMKPCIVIISVHNAMKSHTLYISYIFLVTFLNILATALHLNRKHSYKIHFTLTSSQKNNKSVNIIETNYSITSNIRDRESKSDFMKIQDF